MTVAVVIRRDLRRSWRQLERGSDSKEDSPPFDNLHSLPPGAGSLWSPAHSKPASRADRRTIGGPSRARPVQVRLPCPAFLFSL